MIALAHTLHPHLDFREGSAEELPLDSSSFDAVISGFGVGHFSRPERVLAEFARVLIPKGRVALSWWDGFGKNRINGIFFEAINELRISAPDALPAGPAVDTFSDPTEFVRFCALRLYSSHTHSKALMSFGISRLEVLCGYQLSSEPRPPTFSNGYEPR
jgi:SAM-dependent methyltransferase